MGVDEATLNLVRAHMHSVRVPQHQDKVYKEECMFSYDTPESPGGLYINLSTFQGFGEAYVGLDHARTRNGLYLHDKWTPVPPTPEEAAAEEEAKKAAQLSAGPEGGLRLALGGVPSVKLDKRQSLVVMGQEGPQAMVSLPCPDLPERVLQAIAGVMSHESVSVREAAAVWEEERRVSRYAEDLPQLPTNGKKISPNPKDWRCEETGATENLWLNLSTGFIGSGRKNWDGSGGNGSALRHFEATGRKYPLVVKLGTITPHGADVFSYAADEDDMVTDPYLDKHLEHWGINMMQMSKSEKTMAELQLALNTSYEFSRITESGQELRRVNGPGLTGLINLGNSCYMNSVLQMLYAVPAVAHRYAAQAPSLFQTAPNNPADDLPAQLAKVGVAIIEGRTGHVPPPTAMEQDNTLEAVPPAPGAASDPEVRAVAVRPQSFKSLVGRGHPEFSSGRQQDALEYFSHLLELLSRAEHAHAGRVGVDPSSLNLGVAPTRAAFAFKLEDRLQCMETGAVRYVSHEEQYLGLNIPLDAAINKEAVEAYKEREARRAHLQAEDAAAYIGAGPADGGVTAGSEAVVGGSSAVVAATDKEPPVIPQVPLAACLAAWSGDEVVSDVYSPAAGKRCTASKHTRFATFPPFLLLSLKRYYTSENWVPKKMEVEVEVPEQLSLESLRGTGPQPGEVLQPEDAAEPAPAPTAAPAAAQPAAPAAAPSPDPVIVASLVSMGFSEPAASRAALAVRNGGTEAAMEWLLGHLEDPGINDPLPDAAAAAAAAPAQAPAQAQAQAQAQGGGGGGGTEAAGSSLELISSLTAMGFTDQQATAALKACSNNVERAADWLFSHMDDLDSAVASVMQQQQQPQAQQPGAGGAGAAAAAKPVIDGPGQYELVGIVSHMGANTACGHYVAHIKKNGRWYIFNDEKVAESERPPRELGYLYLFKRTSE